MSPETWQVCWVCGSHTGRQALEGCLREGGCATTGDRRAAAADQVQPAPPPLPCPPPPASPECKLVVMFLHPFRCDHNNAGHRLREKVLLSH